MRAGRGAGCVVKPVRPVGVLGSRYLPGLTLASSRSELRMLMTDSAWLPDLKKWTCRNWSPTAHGQFERALAVDARPNWRREANAKQIGCGNSSFRDQPTQRFK